MIDRLTDVLSEVFGLRKDQVTSELTQNDVGNWDSLKQMDLITSIEREFEITLEIQEIIRMNSVANIIGVLQEKGVNIGA